MSGMTLVLGGARSGKTSFAIALASGRPAPVVYVATAERGDPEMAARIARHRAERPAAWRTLELSNGLDERLTTSVEPGETVLIDCLSVWLSNELLSLQDWKSQADGSFDQSVTEEAELRLLERVARLAAWSSMRDGETIVVSNEVGSGIVPAYPLGRLYRDILGRSNQRIAASSSSTFLIVAGIGVDLRSLAHAFIAPASDHGRG